MLASVNRELPIMSIATVKKFVVTPIVVSAGVFCVLTLPLNLFGSKPVAIQLQKEPLFFGQVKEFAPPYLAVTGLISLGTGIITVSMIGWQHSARKSSQVKEQISDLEQHLQEKQEMLEALRLKQFCSEAASSTDVSEVEVIPQSAPVAELDVQVQSLSSHQAAEEPSYSPGFSSISSVVEPLVFTPHPIEPQPVVLDGVKVQEAAAKFASAQAFLGYTQVKDSVPQPTLMQPTPITTSETEEINHQLQQIMEQVSSLQQALRSNVQTVNVDKQPTSQQHPNFSVLRKYG